MLYVDGHEQRIGVRDDRSSPIIESYLGPLSPELGELANVLQDVLRVEVPGFLRSEGRTLFRVANAPRGRESKRLLGAGADETSAERRRKLARERGSALRGPRQIVACFLIFETRPGTSAVRAVRQSRKRGRGAPRESEAVGGVYLTAPLTVDLIGPGVYDPATPAPGGAIPAGYVVNSYLVHLDSDTGATLSGTLLFDEPILGVIFAFGNLINSDFLGNSTYSTTDSDRGLASSAADQDVVVWTGTRTIFVELPNYTSTDQLRIITSRPLRNITFSVDRQSPSACGTQTCGGGACTHSGRLPNFGAGTGNPVPINPPAPVAVLIDFTTGPANARHGVIIFQTFHRKHLFSPPVRNGESRDAQCCITSQSVCFFGRIFIDADRGSDEPKDAAPRWVQCRSAALEARRVSPGLHRAI